METTFPRLMLQHAEQRPLDPAIREKEYGIWQTWSWANVAQDVRHLACGLASLGLAKGHNLALVSDNRPYAYMSFIAAQCLRAVPVPMYQDAVASEMAYVVADGQATIVFAENQEQVDKLLEIRETYPQLHTIIYDDPRGMRAYDQPGLLSVEQLLELGRQWDKQHPDFFERSVEAGQPDDVSVILYTSGTTGKPKGVCQTHRSFSSAAKGAAEIDGLNSKDNVISYLPPAWVGDHLFSLAQWLVAGFSINCAESSDTVQIDLKEIGPTYYFAPPRVFEGLLTSVTIRMEDTARIKRWMYAKAMEVAQRVGADILDGKSVSALSRLQYALGNVLVYGPLRNVMGFSRIRVAYTAGAAIGPELFKFYRSIGINLKQFYGQTETCAYVCLQKNGRVKLNTVGEAAPGIELKIADNGEVLVKGVSVLKEYYNRPEATAEIFNEDGWFMTGDAGVLDSDGQLRIIDRAKDVGRLNSGAMFAPNYIENKLKFFPQVKEAVCFGHGRNEVSAFINIDFEAVGNWAEKRNLPYAGYVDLAGKQAVLDMIGECIAKVNRELASEEGMEATQVTRFLVLHKELDPDDDELTRTRKIRRNFVAEKYAVLIDALYSGKQEQYIETLVKFEDGRSGNVSATLAIMDAVTVPVQRKAA